MADDTDVLQLLGQINSAAAEPPLSLAEKVLGYSRSYLSGPTFNFADNIEAAATAPFTDSTYSQELARIRSEQERFKRNTDYLDNATEIVSGAILNPLDKVKKLAQGAKYGANFLSTLLTNPASQAALTAVGADNGQDPLKAALIGGAVGTGGAIISNKIGGTIGNAEREADRLKTSAYGITASDINKQLRKMGDAVDTIADADSIPIVRSIEKYENAGIINAGNDIIDNIKNLYKVQKEIGGRLNNALKEADSIIPPNPDFQLDNTLAYIEGLSGKAKTRAADAAYSEISALADQMKTGTLEDLQRLKVGLNYKFDDNPYSDDIIKAIRSDIRQEIENRVDTATNQGLIKSSSTPGVVKFLNREWGEAAELKDLLRKKAGADFGGDLVDDIMLSGSTTGKGATGSLNIAGAVTGNPTYWGLSALLQGAKVPLAKSKLADYLREAEQTKLSTVGKFLEKYGNARTSEQIYESTKTPKPYAGEDDSIENLLGKINAINDTKPEQDNQKQPSPDIPTTGSSSESEMTGSQRVNSLFNRTTSQFANQDYSFMNTLFKGDRMDNINSKPLVEAVMWQESRNKADAVSPKGATGLMQIMPDTAEEIAQELGIKNYDLKDPETNKIFGEYYLNKMLKMFGGDLKLALAAYNAGPGAVRKWIDRWGADWDTISRELEKRGWYKETTEYVPSVRKKVEALKA